MSDFIFNAKEVFDIAIQIERNGADFYREAMTIADNPDARAQLKDLAEMEDTHIEVFTNLKDSLVDKNMTAEWFDPDGEAAAYLKVIAGKIIFDMSKDTTEVLPKHASMRDILEIALQMEKDSVLYYTGLQSVVPAELGVDKIKAITAQEMAHVTLLSRQLDELPKTD